MSDAPDAGKAFIQMDGVRYELTPISIDVWKRLAERLGTILEKASGIPVFYVETDTDLIWPRPTPGSQFQITFP